MKFKCENVIVTEIIQISIFIIASFFDYLLSLWAKIRRISGLVWSLIMMVFTLNSPARDYLRQSVVIFGRLCYCDTDISRLSWDNLQVLVGNNIIVVNYSVNVMMEREYPNDSANSVDLKEKSVCSENGVSSFVPHTQCCGPRSNNDLFFSGFFFLHIWKLFQHCDCVFLSHCSYSYPFT